MTSLFTVLAVCSIGLIVPPAEWIPQSPKVDPVLEREVYDRFLRVNEDASASNLDREDYFEAIFEELGAIFSPEAVVLNLVFILSGAGSAEFNDNAFKLYVSILLGHHMPNTRERFALFAPYWPLEDTALREILANDVFGSVVSTQGKPDTFNTDFALIIDMLTDAWERGNHELDGMLDFMFERHAIAAYLALLETEGAPSDKRRSEYDRLVATAHPYGEYYRARPDALPQTVIDTFMDILREYSKSDSLWARVFVAEVFNKVPYMRDPAIEEALRADPHWLIQRRLKYLDEAEAESEPPASAE